MYSVDQVEAHKEYILQQIKQGRTLQAVLRDDGLPSYGVVWTWLQHDKQFFDEFARAKLAGCDALADEALHIADNPHYGMESEEQDAGGNVIKRTVKEMDRHRRMRIDTRLKLISMWHPEKYGNKAEVKLTGVNLVDLLGQAGDVDAPSE